MLVAREELKQLMKKCLNTSEKLMISELQLMKLTKNSSKLVKMLLQNMKNSNPF